MRLSHRPPADSVMPGAHLEGSRNWSKTITATRRITKLPIACHPFATRMPPKIKTPISVASNSCLPLRGTQSQPTSQARTGQFLKRCYLP